MKRLRVQSAIDDNNLYASRFIAFTMYIHSRCGRLYARVRRRVDTHTFIAVADPEIIRERVIKMYPTLHLFVYSIGQ